MDDLAYLPAELASRSLSTREIVLNLHDTGKAVRLLTDKGIAVLGWEVWRLYSDGSRGHAGHRSGYSNARGLGEAWPDFVRRLACACLDTAPHAHAFLKDRPDHSGAQFYFCLSVTAEGEYD